MSVTFELFVKIAIKHELFDIAYEWSSFFRYNLPHWRIGSRCCADKIRHNGSHPSMDREGKLSLPVA